MNILHVANDEKFIDQAVRQFQQANTGKNDLALYCKGPPKFVKTKPIIQFSYLIALTGISKKKLAEYDLIIYHALILPWYPSIINTPRNIPKLWLGWGFDYYDLIYKDQRDLYMPRTTKLMNGNNSNKPFIPNMMTILKKKLRPKASVISKIDYFAPVLSTEYSKVKSYCENINPFPTQLTWNYGTLEDDLIKGVEEKNVNGENVILGNSSHPSNNHLEVMDILENSKSHFDKLICPLSYGDNLNYKKLLIEEANHKFSNKFYPLTEFLPINDYNLLLLSCNSLIINSIRQQAYGNILIMLYLGSNVFLNIKNPLYQFLCSNGAVLFTIEDLQNNHALLSNKLSSQDRTHNRIVVNKLFSREQSLDRTSLLLHNISTHHLSKNNDFFIER